MEAITDLREQVERERLKRQLSKEKALTKLQEGAFQSFTGDAWGDLVDRRDRYRDAYPHSLSALIRSPSESRRGSHPVAFQNLEELFEIQDYGKLLADSNVFCLSALNAVADKVVAQGFVHRAAARAGQEPTHRQIQSVQDEIDRFSEVNLWNEWEWEFFHRSRYAGEAICRYFDRGPVLLVRSVESQQVIQPGGETWGREWSYGVHCDPQDGQTVLGFYVSYDGKANDGTEVPAHEIEHYKINVERVVRRGLSDFFCIGDQAQSLVKLLRNLTQGASLLAAIAWIEQYATAAKTDVEAFADEVLEFTQQNQVTGETERNERIQPGTIIRTNKGKEYVAPPLATANTPGLVEIARQSKLAIATRWSAPELCFGDASNGNYASLSVAESPFVARAMTIQKYYGTRFRRTMLRAIEVAIRAGRLDSDILGLVDVHTEPPPIIARDKGMQTQVNETLCRNGIMSPQTWAQIEDLDFDEETGEIARAKAAGWEPAEPQPAPGLPLPESRIRGPFALWNRLGR